MTQFEKKILHSKLGKDCLLLMDSLGSSDKGFFNNFFRDYKNRMEAVPAFEAGIDAEGINYPGRDEVLKKYLDYTNSGRNQSSQSARELVETYIPYRDRVAKELRQKGFPDIQSGLDDFEQKTGVTDYSTGGGDGSVGTYEYEQPLHELLSHKRPYDLGMAPDYRDFYAGTDPKGNPVIVKSNYVTPLNEQLAVGLDSARERLLGGNKDMSMLLNPITGDKDFNEVMEESLEEPRILDDASRELMPKRIELQYPVRFNEEAKNYLRGANELLKEKYMKPADQRLAGLLATQFPGVSTVSEKTGGGTFGNVEGLLELVEQYEGKPTDRSQYFYGTLLPGVTPETITRMAGDIRRTPSSLLPGVADLIPSAEAVRLGYEKDPAAMGKQMAKDFAAGIPLSAALTPILANPAVAPFAPGIGAGLLGVAGGEAVNEVVKQETGKSLIQRFQETMGAAGGDTTIIGKARRPVPDKKFVPDNRPYETPQITQMSPADVSRMEVERKAKQNENEFQRRVRLAKEARQSDPFDFGITEMLFGR